MLKIVLLYRVLLEMLVCQGMRCPIQHVEIELSRYGYGDYSSVFVCHSNIEIEQVKYRGVIYWYIRNP